MPRKLEWVETKPNHWELDGFIPGGVELYEVHMKGYKFWQSQVWIEGHEATGEVIEGPLDEAKDAAVKKAVAWLQDIADFYADALNQLKEVA